MRRLPIYFLLDCSESMVGEAFEGMQKGLKLCLSELNRDPAAMELAYISVITFATTAKQIVPLTELCQFKIPKLTLGSGTALGAALQLLEDRINREVVRGTMQQKGDYKPIVFIMTDGEPTDQWLSAANRIMHNRHIQTIVVGIGSDVNLQSLLKISETVIHARVPEQENFSRFFKFVSSSVSTASQQIDSGGEGKIDLQKLPETDNLVIVDNSSHTPDVIPNRLFFLHLQCSNTNKYVLVKYEKTSERTGVFSSKPMYELIDSYSVDEFDFSENDKKMTISSEQLTGEFICPCCGNETWCMCSCGGFFCSEYLTEPTVLECPWCDKTDIYAPSNFDLGGGAG